MCPNDTKRQCWRINKMLFARKMTTVVFGKGDFDAFLLDLLSEKILFVEEENHTGRDEPFAVADALEQTH